MKPQSLAHALIALAEKTTPKKAVASLAHMLEAKGKAKLLGAIKTAVVRAGKGSAHTLSTIVVARDEDAARAKKMVGDTHARLVVDESIVGGYRHITKNTLTDASHKAQLEALFTRITQ